MSYDEHLISMAGGDGDGCGDRQCSYQGPHNHGFACNPDCVECTAWLDMERQPPEPALNATEAAS